MHNTEINSLVSVIIPVKNGGRTLGACLQSIKRSNYKRIEVIVVDDHSTDNSVEIARSYNCKVLQSDEGDGANRARNLGAKNAEGDILVFVDSDVVIRRETILTVVESLEDNGIDAVVGVYTTRHRNENLVSQYKNLWIRYSYLKSPPAIDWLFGAISGIKRNVFEKIGGFDVELLAQHGNDDIELGKRFARTNFSIALNVDIEVEHLKNYTLSTFIKNEFNRSIGFAKLATSLGETKHSLTKGFANIYPAFVISTLLSIVVIGVLSLALFGIVDYSLVAVAVGMYSLMNIRFLNYLEQVRGLFAMVAMVPLLFLDHIVCFVGSVVGIVKGLMKKG